MPVVSRDALGFYSVAWPLKLLQSKDSETSIWHARPFASIFLETSIWCHWMIKVKIFLAWALRLIKCCCLWLQHASENR
jgi:hypothetical protein